jgi:cysteine desulfurase/selenocysteine lyase
MCVFHEPPVKKTLYWCEDCNVPLIGKSCACGATGKRIDLLQPYDVRPALEWDMALIQGLVRERFGNVPLQKILLLNKIGGVDRADLVIMNGDRLGFLTFDPVGRKYQFDIAPEALPYVADRAKKGIADLTTNREVAAAKGRIGGKKFRLEFSQVPVPEGTVIVRYKEKFGTGTVRAGEIRVKEISVVSPRTPKNPGWDLAIRQNRYHLKNLERSAIRVIRQHIHDRPTINVSFSGGKDSTAVLHIAKKAGVQKAFFIDTGIELPETIAFVESMGVEIVRKAMDFWSAAEKAGPPGKDNRWCCKLLKLHPLKIYLAGIGPCVTVQGNRWYESWNRAGLDETSQNPANPLQLNISPIRNWRALEVFLYLWWQDVAINPLYAGGLERIGCFLCPAMLESEYEELRTLHPEYAARWDAFIRGWAEKKGYPEAYCAWGLWRWRALPAKMRELCRNRGIAVDQDHAVVPGPGEREKCRLERKLQEHKAMVNAHPTPERAKPENGVDVDKIRKDFPVLGDIVYLDNAATSFSPLPVIDAMVEFERSYRANVGRGVHRLTQVASQRYWHAHEKVAGFIGGSKGVTVFTRNTTEAINMVAAGLSWSPGDRVATTGLEHHSNLLPWLNLKKQGVATDIVSIGPEYAIDPAKVEAMITERTRLVTITHASNVLGVITPVQEIGRICKKHNVLFLVDAAQTVPHMPIDAGAIGCDFLVFSGHKMLGPTGIGILWMRDAILEPSILGGGMVESVRGETITYADGYQRYEAGTPNIGGGIGLGAAVDYLSGIGMGKIRIHEEALTTQMIDGLSKISGVRVFAPSKPKDRAGVVSFTVEGMHPHEVAQALDEMADIMVRSGHHCCQPLMDYLGLPEGTVRASVALYNTKHEIELLLATIEELAR